MQRWRVPSPAPSMFVVGACPRRHLAAFPPQSQDDLRTTSILRARLKEPRTPGDKAPSTRQLRVAGMLQDAMSRVLDERLVEDPDLYPRGVPVQVFDVRASPCLRYAVFLWSVPLRDKVSRPQRYRGRQGADAAPDPDAIGHLSRGDAAVVTSTSAALNRCASRLKQFMLPYIKMKYVPHITFQRYVDHDELEVFEGLLHEYAEVLKASDKA